MRLIVSTVFGLNLLLSNFCLMPVAGAQMMPTGQGSHEHAMADEAVPSARHAHDCVGHCLLSAGSTAERAFSVIAPLFAGWAVATAPFVTGSSLTCTDNCQGRDSALTHPPNPTETIVLRC